MTYSADLIVPIEMVGYPLASSSTAEMTFTRTSTALNPSNYDGNCTYEFEIVASNANASNAYDVHLYDLTNTTEMATCNVAANQTDIKRIRSSSFTPNSGNNTYQVRVSQTGSASDVKVYSARMVVSQSAATQTRVQIPLTAYNYSTTSNSNGAALDSTTSTSYTQATATYYAQWLRTDTNWGTVASVDFEAVIKVDNVAGTAYAELYNVTDAGDVVESEVSTSATSDTLLTNNFTSDTNWDDGDVYDVRIKASSGRIAYINFACLYLNITSMTKGEVYWRVGLRSQSSAAIDHLEGRTKLDHSSYSSPVLHHEVTAYEATSGEAKLKLYDHDTNDSGSTSPSTITNSLLTPGTTKGIIRSSSALTAPTSGDRVWMTQDDPTYVIYLSSSWLVIQWAGSEGGPATNYTDTESITPWSSVQYRVKADGGAYTLSNKIYRRTADISAVAVTAEAHLRVRERTAPDVAACVEASATGSKAGGTTKQGTASIVTCAVAAAGSTKPGRSSPVAANDASASGSRIRLASASSVAVVVASAGSVKPARTAPVAVAVATEARVRVRERTAPDVVAAVEATATGEKAGGAKSGTASIVAVAVASAASVKPARATPVVATVATADGSRVRLATSAPVAVAVASAASVKPARATLVAVAASEAAAKRTRSRTGDVFAVAVAAEAHQRTRSRSAEAVVAVAATASVAEVEANTASIVVCALAEATGSRARGRSAATVVVALAAAGSVKPARVAPVAVVVATANGNKLGQGAGTADVFAVAVAEAGATRTRSRSAPDVVACVEATAAAGRVSLRSASAVAAVEATASGKNICVVTFTEPHDGDRYERTVGGTIAWTCTPVSGVTFHLYAVYRGTAVEYFLKDVAADGSGSYSTTSSFTIPPGEFRMKALVD